MGEKFDWSWFINNLWERENALGLAGKEGKGGYKDGRYYPYHATNGWDVGLGFDMEYQSDAFKQKAYKEGYSKEELDDSIKARYMKELPFIEQRIIKEGGDPLNVPNEVIGGLLDIFHTRNNGLYSEFPKLWKAVASGDYEGMQRESRIGYYEENKPRTPEFWHYDDGRWEFRKDNYFKDPNTTLNNNSYVPVFDYSEKRDAIQPLNPYSKKIEDIVVQEEGPYRENYGVTSSEKRAEQIRAAVKAKHDYEKIMKATNLKSTATEFKPKFTFDTGGFLQPKDAWDALSMEAKAEMMKVAISHGIYNLDDIRKKYNEFAEGGSKKDLPAVEPYEQREEVVITPDTEYNMYLNTLPDNQRFTPNDRYDSYLYWKLNGRPRNFLEAVRKGMFTYDHSDNGYHANSIAFDDSTGIGYFMKPKDHDTVGYELDWFNKGLVTEEGGKQRPVTPKEAVELNEFRRNYTLTDDPYRLNFFMYQPIERANGGGIHIAPSKKGTFTAAASKHGKSVQAFASQVLAHKENYSPAMVKKANFARNAAKWHGEGGNLFDGEHWPTQRIQIGIKTPSLINFSVEDLIDNGEKVEQQRKALEESAAKRANDYLTMSNDATSTANGRQQNQHLEDRVIKGAEEHRAWEEDNPNLTAWGNVTGAIPLMVPTIAAGIPALSIAGSSFATAVRSVTPLVYNAGKTFLPWLDRIGTGYFGYKGIKNISHGDFTPSTALDLLPLAGKAIEQGSKILPYRRLERNYTGVPHNTSKDINGVELKNSDGSPIYMDDNFPFVHKDVPVWATDDVDYAKMFTLPQKDGNPIGTIFSVYTDPKKLKVLDTPTPPDNGVFFWRGLPFKAENGSIKLSDNIEKEFAGFPKSKEVAINNRGKYGKYDDEDTAPYIFRRGESQIEDWDSYPSATSTDDVVEFSQKHGYDATRFHRVDDGPSFIGTKKYHYPVNELVLNKGAEKYVLPFGAPKLWLWPQIEGKNHWVTNGLFPILTDQSKDE